MVSRGLGRNIKLLSFFPSHPTSVLFTNLSLPLVRPTPLRSLQSSFLPRPESGLRVAGTRVGTGRRPNPPESPVRGGGSQDPGSEREISPVKSVNPPNLLPDLTPATCLVSLGARFVVGPPRRHQSRGVWGAPQSLLSSLCLRLRSRPSTGPLEFVRFRPHT